MQFTTKIKNLIKNNNLKKKVVELHFWILKSEVVFILVA